MNGRYLESMAQKFKNWGKTGFTGFYETKVKPAPILKEKPSSNENKPNRIRTIFDMDLYERRILVSASNLFSKFPREDAIKICELDPHYVYYYANDILKGRWIEMEKFILTDAHYSWLYARDVIKGKWLEAESIIKKDEWLSYYYDDGNWGKGIKNDTRRI